MNIYVSILLLSIVFLVFTKKMITQKKNSQLSKVWSIAISLMIICCVGLSLQIVFSPMLNIPPIYFDYIVYIGTCFLPIAIYFIGSIYTNTKIEFSKKYVPLFIPPIVSLLTLWTNDFHHLFYKNYSVYMSEAEVGPIFSIYSIYQYILIFLGVYKLLKFNIKNSGFFSKQSLLIILAISIPLIANMLGTLRILPITIYITPICFTFTLFFLSIAMFKYNFLDAAPIALQKIVDKISDSYVVLNENGIITDFNKTFIITFNTTEKDLRNQELLEFFKSKKYKINLKNFSNAIKKSEATARTQIFNETFDQIEKTFTVEISDIVNQGKYLGSIVLFKDITQHMQDMEQIKNNQDMLVERERLASLGQMIGGIAHNLKTPIFSIAGGLEGIRELVKEYEASLDAPQVTKEDMYAIGDDIEEWLNKMQKYLEYMSDIITAVKGQAVTFSDNTNIEFSISETFKNVELLMQHDLKHSLTSLYTDNTVPDEIMLKGNMNGLIQVIDNLISNAIYAYKSIGKQDQVIDLSAHYYKRNNWIEIRVKDYGPGLPQEVQNKLFKEMITTKGKEGTGLGIFMSASNIRAQFNGKISFETKEGKGTTFIITLPVPEKTEQK